MRALKNIGFLGLYRTPIADSLLAVGGRLHLDCTASPVVAHHARHKPARGAAAFWFQRWQHSLANVGHLFASQAGVWRPCSVLRQNLYDLSYLFYDPGEEARGKFSSTRTAVLVLF